MGGGEAPRLRAGAEMAEWAFEMRCMWVSWAEGWSGGVEGLTGVGFVEMADNYVMNVMKRWTVVETGCGSIQ